MSTKKRILSYAIVAIICFGIGLVSIHKNFDNNLTSVDHSTLDAALEEYYG